MYPAANVESFAVVTAVLGMAMLLLSLYHPSQPFLMLTLFSIYKLYFESTIPPSGLNLTVVPHSAYNSVALVMSVVFRSIFFIAVNV